MQHQKRRQWNAGKKHTWRTGERLDIKKVSKDVKGRGQLGDR